MSPNKIIVLLQSDGTAALPQLSTTLICLLRHRHRQRWVATLVDHIKPAHGIDLPGRPLVPGRPDWSYYFHGIGCAVVNVTDGTCIDVDFYEHPQGRGEYFDPYFLLRYLRSLEAPEPIEAALLALHPELQTITLAMEGLTSAGLLRRHENGHVFCLDDAVIAAETQILQLSDRLPQAPDCQERWLAFLKGFLASPKHGADAFCGILAALPSLRDRQAALLVALKGSDNRQILRALQYLLAHPDRACNEEVRAFLQRPGAMELPLALITATRYLLEHGIARAEALEALEALKEAPKVGGSSGNPFIAEVAEVFLAHAPERALGTLRLGLESSVPHTRSRSAVILEQLGKAGAAN